MSAHYAMCKYDDATGSYIPLEVRPITDALKNDEPLYQEGFQAGAASRDAEILELTTQRTAFKDAAEYNKRRAEDAERQRDDLVLQAEELQRQLDVCGGVNELLRMRVAEFEEPDGPEPIAPRQDWKGMDGAIAWNLIDRHADGWSDVGRMMNEWLEANSALKQRDDLLAGLKAARFHLDGQAHCDATRIIESIENYPHGSLGEDVGAEGEEA